MAAGKRLPKIVELLRPRYEADGKRIELTDLRDPFLLGAWYILGQRAKRNGQARAYEALRRAKGLTPANCWTCPKKKLAAIAQTAGPYEDARARDLYAFADLIEEKCGQDFSKVFKSAAAARKFLEGELKKPRAFVDFLLLYGGRFAVFPLDAHVVRVAARLGLGKLKSDKELEEKSYQELQKALESEAPKEASS